MFATAVVILGLGYVGMLGAESAEFRPARIVDAVVDTNHLAVGTAVHSSDPLTANALAAGVTQPADPSPATVSTVVSLPVPTTTAPITTTPSATVTTATAPSTTTTTMLPTTPPPPSPRQRGEEALASFNYDWRNGLPGWEISFHPGRQGVLGYTFVQEKRIEIYVRKEMSQSLLGHVIAHEVGHAIDVSQNSGDDRRRWQEMRAIEDQPWWPGSGSTDFSTGAGDFAESFAAWQVGTASFRSNLGPPPDSAARALMAELVKGS